MSLRSPDIAGHSLHDLCCGRRRAPVHVVTGSAGCQEGRDHFRKSPLSWSAFRSQDYGYTRFKALNNTHINIEQVSVDADGQVVDGFWLVKERGPHTAPASVQL